MLPDCWTALRVLFALAELTLQMSRFTSDVSSNLLWIFRPLQQLRTRFFLYFV